MGALDAWQRFLSGQQTDLTRQQVAEYQGAVAERKLAMDYKMHREKLVVDKQKLAANLGFRYDQLEELTDRWTQDRGLRTSMQALLKEKWGEEAADRADKMLTDVAIWKARLTQAERAAQRKDLLGVQKALGYIEDEQGNMIPTIEREKAAEQEAYHQGTLKQQHEDAEARNTYYTGRLDLGKRGLMLKAAGVDEKAQEKQRRQSSKIPAARTLLQSDIDAGAFDTFLLDPVSAMPIDLTANQKKALGDRQESLYQQRDQEARKASGQRTPGDQLIHDAQQRAQAAAPQIIGPRLPTPKPIRVPRLPGIPTPSEPAMLRVNRGRKPPRSSWGNQ